MQIENKSEILRLMTQEKTAREMLAWIEKKFFKGAGLAKASLLKGDERGAYKLAQVERLLTDRYGNPLMALYLTQKCLSPLSSL